MEREDSSSDGEESDEEAVTGADDIDSPSDVETEEEVMEVATATGEQKRGRREGSKNEFHMKKQDAKREAAKLEVPYLFAGRKKNTFIQIALDTFCRKALILVHW